MPKKIKKNKRERINFNKIRAYNIFLLYTSNGKNSEQAHNNPIQI